MPTNETPIEGVAHAFANLHGDVQQIKPHREFIEPPKEKPGDPGYYATCDDDWCRTKLEKVGDFMKCSRCGLSRAILPGEILGY